MLIETARPAGGRYSEQVGATLRKNQMSASDFYGSEAWDDNPDPITSVRSSTCHAVVHCDSVLSTTGASRQTVGRLWTLLA